LCKTALQKSAARRYGVVMRYVLAVATIGIGMVAGCRDSKGRGELEVGGGTVIAAQATTRPMAAAPTPTTTRAAAMPVRRLIVEADIDGSDELHVAPRGVTWVHKLWAWPSNVVVNGKPWDVQAGPTSFQELGLNFAPGEWERAGLRVVSKEGRDTVAVEPSGDGVVIYFADSENGAARYRVVVEFGE
jgi:hypothetical protein